MILRSATLLLVLGPLATEGIGAQCPPVQVGDPHGNYFVPGVQGKIVYRRVAGRELALDAYVQQGGETRPGMIVVHGGNWTSGSRVAYVGQLLELLTETGLNWFSIDYRLAPESPPSNALDDLRAALEFVRCNAAHFRTDPERLGLLGEDTGATLAALLASEKPSGVGALVTLGAAFELAGERRQFSPLGRVSSEMPPVLAIHGAADSKVPLRQADDYCRAVREQGGACRVLPVPGGIHRAENWTPSQWNYKRQLADWLRETLDCRPCAHQPYDSPRLRKNILFQQKGGLKLDAWIPEGPGPFPAVVLAHGGDGRRGTRSRTSRRCSSRWPAPTSPGSPSTTASRRTSATRCSSKTCAGRSASSGPAPPTSASIRSGSHCWESRPAVRWHCRSLPGPVPPRPTLPTR